MAVITDQATAETIANLLTRTRRALGDTDTSTTNQRWSDAEIIDGINLEMFKMSAEWGLGQTTQAITSTTLTYTASADTVALPSGPDVNPIFLIEDYSDSNNPLRIENESFLSANEYSRSSTSTWSRAGSSIALRPAPDSSTTLRIWYVRPPYATSTSYGGTDQQPWPIQHEELITLGAAIRLQEVDGEIPPNRMERYADLWMRFVRSKNHNRGPQHVRNNRKYRA